MEVDTGAAVTLMSEAVNTEKLFPNAKLEKCTVKLQTEHICTSESG